MPHPSQDSLFPPGDFTALFKDSFGSQRFPSFANHRPVFHRRPNTDLSLGYDRIYALDAPHVSHAGTAPSSHYHAMDLQPQTRSQAGRGHLPSQPTLLSGSNAQQTQSYSDVPFDRHLVDSYAARCGTNSPVYLSHAYNSNLPETRQSTHYVQPQVSRPKEETPPPQETFPAPVVRHGDSPCQLHTPSRTYQSAESWLRKQGFLRGLPPHMPVTLDALTTPRDPDDKPAYTMFQLAAVAIFSHPKKRASSSDIRDMLRERFPYYRDKRELTETLKHALSSYSLFRRVSRDSTQPGRGGLWELDVVTNPQGRRVRIHEQSSHDSLSSSTREEKEQKLKIEDEDATDWLKDPPTPFEQPVPLAGPSNDKGYSPRQGGAVGEVLNLDRHYSYSSHRLPSGPEAPSAMSDSWIIQSEQIAQLFPRQHHYGMQQFEPLRASLPLEIALTPSDTQPSPRYISSIAP